ncbi:MAG: nucleotidyl transferase AbiEii/AbiGii toxin family protein [Rhizobiales bacterium]|nr:nucleotidyl transferase AbiEii/AbiGii toxin family protein [Hyphomicrobiales bacterium]
MPPSFEPKITVLPPAQRTIWPQLAPTRALSFVLYGGTAVALHLGHRRSLDFDFFSLAPLNKARLATELAFMREAKTLQDRPNTLVVTTNAISESIKISFFGGIVFGHINEPLVTNDTVLLVASPEDLLATKLKSILDRAEAKNYIDIAAILSAGISLERALGAFSAMFNSDPALPLRALGYFKDGDLSIVPAEAQDQLRAARDRVKAVPDVRLREGLTG